MKIATIIVKQGLCNSTIFVTAISVNLRKNNPIETVGGMFIAPDFDTTWATDPC